MSIRNLTIESVQSAIAEYDRLGREAFLAQYGYGKARSYFLLHDGKRYDSKAIVGVAHGYLPGCRPLGWENLRGGKNQAAGVLQALGFSIELMASSDSTPTHDRELLHRRTYTLKNRRFVSVPAGNVGPERVLVTSHEYRRDPAVRAWILKQAKGMCECCGQLAPFITDDGEVFLEVHHVKPLAMGGSDTVSNAIALCPNCHRACHLAKNRAEMIERLYQTVTRLVQE